MDENNQLMVISSNVNIAEIIAENMGGGQLDVFNLDRIKIPAGGGTSWSVPTLEGEVDMKALEGVIVHICYQNAYWAQSMEESGGGTPPNCVARDAKIGEGDPGGFCVNCALNKFGSDGKGKSCKNMLLIFLLQRDALLPVVLTLPPTSLKPAKNYLLRLTAASKHYYDVISSFTLLKDKNDAGIAYSVADVKKIGDIDEAGLKKIKEYRDALLPVLQAVSVQQGDIAE
ncbi:MAG: hypothetical protein WC455_23475 [Dehalococcoidia bacterium]|jgi:hypothetical protein